MTTASLFAGLDDGSITRSNFASAVEQAGGRDIVLLEAVRRLAAGGSAAFADITGVPGDNAALASALSAKLDKAGGTMTGNLAAAAGTVGAPGLNFGDASTGIYKNATNGLALTFNGVKRWDFDAFGTLNSYGSPLIVGSYAVATNLYARSNGLNLFMGASDDLLLQRVAAATLQLGANHATTATAQAIKAHDVTTGTGASLRLQPGTGSVDGGEVSLLSASGADILTVNDDGIGLFGVSPVGQQNTSIDAAIHFAGSSSAITEDSTFDGYTVGQVVAALKVFGFLS